MTHPVTEALREVIKERIDEAVEEMLLSNDPEKDRIIKGIVVGYRDVLEWEPEVVDAEVQPEKSGTQGSY